MSEKPRNNKASKTTIARLMAIKENLEAEKQLAREGRALRAVSRLESEQAKRHDYAPTKRHMPRTKRHMSPEQQKAFSQKANLFAAGYDDAEKAARNVVVRDVEGTREVGPGDVYNPTVGYSTGKETQTKTGDSYRRPGYRPQARKAQKVSTSDALSSLRTMMQK